MKEDDLVFTLVTVALLLTKISKCLEIINDILITVLPETPLIELLPNLLVV